VPLTTRGELKVVAYNDLKGLGATDGPALAYIWTPPSLLPPLLPWLAVLALLAARPNHSGRAWLIWCPLGLVVVAANACMTPLLSDILPSEFLAALESIVTSLAFGLAAVWLLSPYLRQRYRVVSFLKVLFACAIMAAFASIVRQDSEEIVEAFALFIFLGACVLLATISFSLAGLVCRRRYRPLGLALWLAVFLLGLALAVTAPFAAIAMAANGGQVQHLGPVLCGVLAVAGGCYAVLLPFLLLAFACDFYRQRLKDLLHLEPMAAPPVLTPPPPAPVT
jgi:hypothetical protein